MKKWSILGGLAAAALVGALAATPVYAKDMKIPEGVFIGEFSLGGMTEAEAREYIEEYVAGQSGREIRLEVGAREITARASDLGFAWSNPEAVEEAAGYAAGGNLVRQYMELKDLEKEPVHIPLETAVDAGKVENFLLENCEGLGDAPQNAAITRAGGKFEITPGKTGLSLDAEATKKALDQAIAQNSTGGQLTVKAVVEEKQPDITEQDLATINDVLGTFSTDFSTSGSARSANIANGAGKVNGHLLMPGETLSGYECMHPFTTENGYYTAAAYENGQVVDSVGGGVCQIATTLYNAALNAELEITQRQNHSMIVSYVKPSMDAAIAGTYKDIKITNNYSTPIYVEGGTSGRTLTFTIYGRETRPSNRKVEYVSETLSVTDPGEPQTRVDASLPPGQTKKVQSAHKGLKSRLWKVVTVDGVETERTVLHTDTYNPSKAIVLVSPVATPPVETQPAETQPAETQPDESQSAGNQTAGNQPEQTQPAGPQPTEAPPQTRPTVIEDTAGAPGTAQPQTEAAQEPSSAQEAAPGPGSSAAGPGV